MAAGSLLDHALGIISRKRLLNRACAVFARAGLWVALPALPAHAEPAPSAIPLPQRVELGFVGGSGCPNRGSFVHEVAARVQRPIEWVSADGAVRITVTISQNEDHAEGTLQIVAGGAEPTRREFTAASCAEVSSALALVTALALDPNARTDALPPSAEVQPEAPAAPSPAPQAAAPAPVAPLVRPVAPRPTKPPPPATKLEPPPRYVAWLGPSIGLDSGYAPETLVTVGVSLGARATLGRQFSPSVQLTPSWGKTGVTGPAASGGTFAWALARLEACPFHVPLAVWAAFEPCLSGELGRLAASSGRSAEVIPVPVDRWWAAGGAAVALHVSRGRWFARLEARGTFPATRDTFVLVSPYQRIHRAAALTYGMGLGLGVELGR